MLRDHESLRVARAVPALARTLAAGFTTIRDLGTEGAGEADIGLKVYADSRHGPGGISRPAFAQEDLALIVRIAADSGCHVAAHAITAEAMRRAALAGVATIEHGNEGTPEVFALMAQHGVAYVPTLAAYEAIWRYRKLAPDDPAYATKRAAFEAARASGVTIVNGSDIGVFPHGENARELELLVEHGMTPLEALRAATSSAARALRRDDLGFVRAAACADLIAVQGDPSTEIGALRRVALVVQAGTVVPSAEPFMLS